MNKLVTLVLTIGVLLSSTVLAPAYAGTISWIAPGVQVNGSTTEYEWEPHIAAKRGSSSVLVAGMIQQTRDLISSTCTAYRSLDGAQSWSAGSFNADPKAGLAGGGDPVVASFVGGTLLYICYGATLDSTTGKLTDSVFRIFKSTDDGVNWVLQNTITVSDYKTCSPQANCQLDKPWIAIDRGADLNYRDRVYLCWTEFDYGAKTTKIYFGRVNLGTTPDFVSGTVKEIASATWLDDANRYKGPYVQGCQIGTGPGQSGVSGNEIFLVWEYVSGTTSGVIKFVPNYSGGSSTGWGTYQDVGTFTRFSDQTSCKPTNIIIDGCLPGDPTAYRATHIPAIAVDKIGNPHVAWTDYISSHAVIKYNHAYNAGTANKNPTWSTTFQLTSSTDAIDRKEPAVNVFEDTSTRGTVIITTLNDISSTDNRWKNWAYHCHPSANTGTGSCHASSEWAAGVINDNDVTDNEDKKFVGDYHGVASTTTKAGINTFAWHRWVPFAWISDTISYRTS